MILFVPVCVSIVYQDDSAFVFVGVLACAHVCVCISVSMQAHVCTSEFLIVYKH